MDIFRLLFLFINNKENKIKIRSRKHIYHHHRHLHAWAYQEKDEKNYILEKGETKQIISLIVLQIYYAIFHFISISYVYVCVFYVTEQKRVLYYMHVIFCNQKSLFKWLYFLVWGLLSFFSFIRGMNEWKSANCLLLLTVCV